MKISTIVRFLSQLTFWYGGIMFYTWFLTLNEDCWMLLAVCICALIATNLARKFKNKAFIFLVHALSAGLLGVFIVTDLISRYTGIFLAAIVILSMIARYAESSFMDKGHSFGMFLLVAMYLVGSVMNYKYMWLQFALIVVYSVLMFLERNVSKNEEYIDGLSYTSVIDEDKMQVITNLMSISFSLVIGLVTVVLSFIGKIPPLAALSNLIKTKLQGSFAFLQRVNINNPVKDDEIIEDSPLPEEGEIIDVPEGTPEEIQQTLFEKIVFYLLIALFIACLIYAIYSVIRYVYNHYLKLYRMGLIDEEQVSLKKKKHVRKEDPSKTDISYSNRKALRKIYKKRIKGKSGRREDFYCRTPYEQRSKSLAEGNAISEEFVELYEKARYSSQMITKDDVKRMGKI